MTTPATSPAAPPVNREDKKPSPWPHRIVLLSVGTLMLFTFGVGFWGMPMVRKQFLPWSGKVVVDRHGMVTAADFGTVGRIWVEPGSKVTAGQTLIDLDTSKVAERISHVELQLAQADAAVAAATYDRLKHNTAWSASETKLHAEKESLQHEWNRLQRELAACRISAPQAGWVSDIKVALGQAVDRGDVLLEIYNPANSAVELHVSKDQVRRGVGTNFEVEFEIHPGQKFFYQLRCCRARTNDYVDEIGTRLQRQTDYVVILEPAPGTTLPNFAQGNWGVPVGTEVSISRASAPANPTASRGATFPSPAR